MRWLAGFLLASIALFKVDSATSDWLSAPKPRFPTGALQKGVEGAVTLRLKLAKDGSVTTVAVVKSSGDRVLDDAARNAVLRWRMKPGAVKPADLERGRVEIVEFKEEAIMAASYPGRVRAAFTREQDWQPWKYAPFPYYSAAARARNETGTVILAVTVGSNGGVAGVQIIQTSGYADLDQSAEIAVRHWQAHTSFIGKTLRVPVTFRRG